MDPLSLMALVGQCAGSSAPPALVYAIVEEESGGQPYIVRDNSTGTVHRFPSYSVALSFVKTHARHSLDIGLMQVNTKAHRGNPARLLSPCGNIREGSKILDSDMSRSGQNLQEALCLYHRGKENCGSYPEKVGAFLPRNLRRRRQGNRTLLKRSAGNRLPDQGGRTKRDIPVLDLADRTEGGEGGGEDPSDVLDSRFRPADVDGFMGR
ncbi:MAG: transglycosylase SLT domain-containing protein [Leptospirales bacterium]